MEEERGDAREGKHATTTRKRSFGPICRSYARILVVSQQSGKRIRPAGAGPEMAGNYNQHRLQNQHLGEGESRSLQRSSPRLRRGVALRATTITGMDTDPRAEPGAGDN